MMRQRDRAGVTLVEFLIGMFLFVVGGSAFLLGMSRVMVHTDYLDEFQVAMNSAQGELERLSATDIDTLWTDAAFNNARRTVGTRGQCVGIGEDTNCDGVLNGVEDLNGNGTLDEPLPGGRLTIQIINVDLRDPPVLLDLSVAACWQSRGRRIGEDQNCNGIIDPGEDVNGNTWADSPAMVSTRVARQD